MRREGTTRQARNEREFALFVAGASGRLLHVATLLTAEPPAANPHARRLLLRALARTYATWGRVPGEDPYDRTRQDVALRFGHTAWRQRGCAGGLLAAVPPRERVVLVLRLAEGLPEEQTAAVLGLPVERVRVLCARAVHRLVGTSGPVA
ncbi:sigma factor-like helix-turn-helix DNA-binding protein [Streptomyces sp. NPDC060194]|uniref:sigma factor-like helix-turn-helix DNA-binding protein n=1 Tax=Streptomyces sp. NPDC060194 TaxID=3347069 RepID=UPI003650B296